MSTAAVSTGRGGGGGVVDIGEMNLVKFSDSLGWLPSDLNKFVVAVRSTKVKFFGPYPRLHRRIW
jgi:hypothetical protein